MNTHVLVAQAARILSRSRLVYVPDVVRALRERYGFVAVPSSAHELLPPQGTPITFQHGKLEYAGRTILIDTLLVFSQAVAVNTSTSTDDAELVLIDFLAWSKDHLGVMEDELDDRHIYSSQLEVTTDWSLESHFSTFDRLGTQMSKFLAGYGQPCPPLQVHSVGMSVDPMVTPFASEFRFERRTQRPYADNCYFSQAPLKTSDHIAVLEALEQILTAGRP